MLVYFCFTLELFPGGADRRDDIRDMSENRRK